VLRQPAGAKRGAAKPAARGKLSFNDQRELAALPARIEALEAERQALTARMMSAEYHRQGTTTIKADRQRAEQIEIEHELAKKLERWVEFDSRGKPAA
jgi:ATP-binding cassette subfamily F protein uup